MSSPHSLCACSQLAPSCMADTLGVHESDAALTPPRKISRQPSAASTAASATPARTMSRQQSTASAAASAAVLARDLTARLARPLEYEPLAPSRASSSQTLASATTPAVAIAATRQSDSRGVVKAPDSLKQASDSSDDDEPGLRPPPLPLASPCLSRAWHVVFEASDRAVPQRGVRRCTYAYRPSATMPAIRLPASSVLPRARPTGLFAARRRVDQSVSNYVEPPRIKNISEVPIVRPDSYKMASYDELLARSGLSSRAVQF